MTSIKLPPEFEVLKSSEAYENAIKEYPNISYDQFKREFAHSYWQQGARWQFDQLVALITAQAAELAELKSANDNCISLLLHESRMADKDRQIKELEDAVRMHLYLDVGEVTRDGIKAGRD